MKTTVAMNADGRLTVPKAVREALHLNGETRLEVEVRDDALILRPAPLANAEEADDDAWARDPERLEALLAATKDAEEGHVWQLNEAQLDRFISWANRQNRERRTEALTYEKITEILSEPQI
jgi:AbrB family looped-hinge helix DNA binding protein